MILRRVDRLVLLAVVALVSAVGCAQEPNTTPTTSAGNPTTAGSRATNSSTPNQSGTATSAGPASASASTGSAASAALTACAYQAAGSAAKAVDPPSLSQVPLSGTVSYTLHLTEGPVTITMDRAKAPCTVNSFASLASQQYFDGTSCHRLTTEGIFVLQCGDPSGTGRGGPGYRYADELAGAKAQTSAGGEAVIYPAGTVAMANSGADTNGSQFFLVWQDSSLQPAYTVFGRMDPASLAVVKGIAAKGVQPNSTRPVSPAKIESVTAG